MHWCNTQVGKKNSANTEKNPTHSPKKPRHISCPRKKKRKKYIYTTRPDLEAPLNQNTAFTLQLLHCWHSGSRASEQEDGDDKGQESEGCIQKLPAISEQEVHRNDASNDEAVLVNDNEQEDDDDDEVSEGCVKPPAEKVRCARSIAATREAEWLEQDDRQDIDSEQEVDSDEESNQDADEQEDDDGDGQDDDDGIDEEDDGDFEDDVDEPVYEGNDE